MEDHMNTRAFLLLCAFVIIPLLLHAQTPTPYVWQDVSEATITDAGERTIVPERYRTVSLNIEALRDILASAPMEFTEEAKTKNVLVSLPIPDGSFQTFRIEESPVMAPELVAKHPEIKTYKGTSVEGPASFVRFGLTPRGFHALILRGAETVFIDPRSRNNNREYTSYFSRDYKASSSGMLLACEFQAGINTGNGKGTTITKIGGKDFAFSGPVGTELRTYRIAIAAVGEYTRYHSLPDPPNKNAARTAIIISLNKVNTIFNRDLSIKLELVPNNDNIIYEDWQTDPYDCGDLTTYENQRNLDKPSNGIYPDYDVGHVFTGGGLPGSCGGLSGSASKGVCDPDKKARGASGFPQPEGDPFEIDQFAHELGHQFGANHVFNAIDATGCSGGFTGTRNETTAYEPGSGSTIMSYAGKCSWANLQSHSDGYFSRISINEIMNYTTDPGAGYACATKTTVTTNQPPANITVPGSYSIPKSTPFALTGFATDPDNDDLTYCWEQFDKGGPQIPGIPPPDNAPIFRSWPPSTSSIRIFPKIESILNHPTTQGEFYATTPRNLTFTMTVRDNKGGSDYGTTSLTVTNAGPFRVKYPCTPVVWKKGSNQTVHWDVANTTASPIGCTMVRILLSTDGGYTWPHILKSGTDNDGEEAILVPDVETTQARIKVEADPAQNVFFAISGTDFTIMDSPATVQVEVKQEYESGGRYGHIGRLEVGPNFTDYIAPHTFGFHGGATEVLKAMYGGTTPNPVDQLVYKYRHWNNNLADVINFREFQIGPTTNELTAILTPRHLGTVLTTRVLESSQDLNGKIEFRDPWYLDYNDPKYFNQLRNRGMEKAEWYEYSTPLTLNDMYPGNRYMGVFLDQEFVPAINSYYSVRVNKDQTSLASVSAHFYKWVVPVGSGIADFQSPFSLSTGVVFRSPSSIIIAQYKAHLLSNAQFSNSESICATCPNSQRKLEWVPRQYGIDYGSTGLHQLVYESAGKIWYTESIIPVGGADAVWFPEQFVSDGNSPSIVAKENGVYITFINDGAVGVYKYQNGAFDDISPNLSDAAGDAAPVIAYDNANMVLVVYERSNGRLRYVLYIDDIVESTGNITDAGISATATRPSITQAGNTFNLTWREQSYIYYKEMSVLPHIPVIINYSQTEFISNSWQDAEGAPSITLDFFGRPAVTWGAIDGLSARKVINFRQKLSAGWGTFATIISQPNFDYWAPSITSFNNVIPQSDDLRIAHNVNVDGIMIQKLDNGYWLVPGLSQSADALHPNLTDFTPNFNSLEVYSAPSTLFSGTVRAVAFTDQHLPKNRSANTLSSSRELILLRDTSRVRVRLGEFQVQVGSNDTPLNWKTGFDTLVVGQTKTVEEYLSTETFQVPANGILKYRIANNRRGLHAFPSSSLFRLQVMSAYTHQVLATVGQIHPNGMNQGRQDVRFTFPLNQLAGKNVYARLQFVGRDSTIQLLAMDYYHDPSMTLPKDGDDDTPMRLIPGEIALMQNHPNPFNPSTEISFSLPFGANAELTVVNLIGQQVASLTTGNHEAGIHTYRFDGTGLPSGLYIARLVVGNTVLTKTMTMLK